MVGYEVERVKPENMTGLCCWEEMPRGFKQPHRPQGSEWAEETVDILSYKRAEAVFKAESRFQGQNNGANKLSSKQPSNAKSSKQAGHIHMARAIILSKFHSLF